MALKYELEQWGAAVEAYDGQAFEESLRIFSTIAESAKFHFNMGLIYATIGEHEDACSCYELATDADRYFAVSYFQKGVSHFLLGDFNNALNSFNNALLYLRGNLLIDYEQLGLKFRLYSCEVLFNRGLCYLYLGMTELGMSDLAYASKEKQTEEHDVIDEATIVQGQGFTVFSVPVGVIYRPAEGKLKNAKTKDYLGKAKLVAAVDPEDAFTGFSGAQKLQNAQMSTTTPITKERTDGRVVPLDGNGPQPGSPDRRDRPRSLSTNPRMASPFPVRGQSVRRPPPPMPTIVQSTPTLSFGETSNGSGNVLGLKLNGNDSGRNNSSTEDLLPTNAGDGFRAGAPRPADIRIHQRSATIDSGKGSPKLPVAPQRQNSVRSPQTVRRDIPPGPAMGLPTRQNSLRTASPVQRTLSPQRSSSLRGRARQGPPRDRSPNNQTRAQYLQQQMQTAQNNMSNMTIVDDTDSASQYATESEQGMLDTESEFNELYDYIMNNETYDTNDIKFKFSSPLLRNNNNDKRDVQNPNMQNPNMQNPNTRNRAPQQPKPTLQQLNPSAYKPSLLRENARPPSPPKSATSSVGYAAIYFNNPDDENPGDDETQFEIVSQPPNSMSPGAAVPPSLNIPPPPSTAPGPPNQVLQVPLKLGPPSKVKIKCYHKDTRVILVPTSIIFDELLKRIQEKFGSRSTFKLKYKDEDGEMVMLTDQEDLEMALSNVTVTAAAPDIGRMELWLEE